MKRKLFQFLALVAGFTLFGGIVGAQPIFPHYDSLELRAARAQNIVRGTVSKCTGTFVERRGGYNGGYGEDGKARPDGVMRYTITVKVDEVLKGKSIRTLELVQETWAGDKRFEQWGEHHTSFVWFNEGDITKSTTWSNLQGIDGQTNKWNTIRLGEPVPAESHSSSDSPIYAQDFTRVTDPKDLVARVRKLAKDRSDPSRVHTFRPVWPPERDNGWASLSVPVNASLEKTGRRMIESPDEFLSREVVSTETNAEQRAVYLNWIERERNEVRKEGINALQYFRSPANIKLVKPFRENPSYQLYRFEDGRLVRKFELRKAAFDTLQKWEMDAGRVVLEEDVPPQASKVKLRLVKVDSEETSGENGRGENAVDGNPATIWHTQWQAESPNTPHEIVVELVPPTFIKGVTYLPRQDESDHGVIKDYEIYASNDGEDFGHPLSKGSFGTIKGKKLVTFEPIECRFIKLRAISEINGLAWTSAAEFCVVEVGEDIPEEQHTVVSTSPIRDEMGEHFGDIAPLKAALARLSAQVPGLTAGAPVAGGAYGGNSITCNCTTWAGSKLEIIAKSYDSASAAEAGQELDLKGVSVNYDKSESIEGVTIFEYTRYGGLYFQVDQYTFRIQTLRRADDELQALLLKISTALINELRSPARSGPSRSAIGTDNHLAGQPATFTP
jgi:hypothetical protein